MDNKIDSSPVILWQYDKAYILQRFLQMKDDLANSVFQKIWDKFRDGFFDIHSPTWLDDPNISDSDRAFGLWLWGGLIGVYRPIKENGEPISDDLYRRLLRARLFLYSSNGSLADLNRYCAYLFDIGEGSSQPSKRVTIEEHEDMTIGYKFNWDLDDDEKALLDVDSDNDGSPDLLPHPTGVKERHSSGDNSLFFGFEGFFTADGLRLYLSPKNMWVNEEGYVRIPKYIGDEREELFYDDVKKDYCFIIEGVKHGACDTNPQTGNAYWEDYPVTDKDGERLKPNATSVPAHKFVFAYDAGGGEKKTTTSAYYRDDYDALHEVSHDSNGWFYTDADGRHDISNVQSLGVFDNSIFKE